MIDRAALQKRIDQDKPIYDYARCYLTTAAWVAGSVWCWRWFLQEVASLDPATFVLSAMACVCSTLFGLALVFHLFLLTDSLAGLLVSGLLRQQGILPKLAGTIVAILFIPLVMALGFFAFAPLVAA